MAIHPRQRFITADEVAFSDALAANESAVKAMGILEMKVITAELVPQTCKGGTIDWTVHEGARAKIMVMVNRILKKHGFRPDMLDEAIKMVMAQAGVALRGLGHDLTNHEHLRPTRKPVTPSWVG